MRAFEKNQPVRIKNRGAGLNGLSGIVRSVIFNNELSYEVQIGPHRGIFRHDWLEPIAKLRLIKGGKA